MSQSDHFEIKITALYRYPVKGLSAQSLQHIALQAGKTMPFDRAYALENGKGKFDPEAPRHLPKINFIMLMRNEKLAALKTRFNDESHELTIKLDGKQVAGGCLDNEEGRREIEQFMASYIPADQLRGAPKIYRAANHSFSDVADKCLHIINMNSVRELEKLAGQAIDPLRFRANVIIDGPPAFAELDWMDRQLQIESSKACLLAFKRTERCPATNVAPANGVRDMTIPDLLFEHFGHRDFGFYARVEQDGMIHKNAKLLLR